MERMINIKKIRLTAIFALIIILLSLSCIILVSGSSYAGEIRDKKNGYILKYPARWKARENPNSTNLIKASIDKDGETGLQVRIYRNKSGNFKKFAEWYVKDTIRQMEGHWGGKMRIIQKGYRRIGKNKGFAVSFDLKRKDGRRYFLKQYMWPRGKKVYLIQSGTPYNKKTTIEPTLDSIANSFDFLK